MAPPVTTRTITTSATPPSTTAATLRAPLSFSSSSTPSSSSSSITSTTPAAALSTQRFGGTLAPLTTAAQTNPQHVSLPPGISISNGETFSVAATLGSAPTSVPTPVTVTFLPPSAATETQASFSSSHNGLSQGGLAAAIIFPLLTLSALLAFYLFRRKKRRHNRDVRAALARGSAPRTREDMSALPSELAWIRTLLERTRLSSPRSLASQRAELPGMRTPRSIYSRAELPGARTPRSVRDRAELPGWRTPRDRERDSSHRESTRDREKVPPVPSIAHLVELPAEEVRREALDEKWAP